jgi:hypothetical protein
LRYRGTAENQAWLKRRTAALNLRDLAASGIARHDGCWVLATGTGPLGSARPAPAR